MIEEKQQYPVLNCKQVSKAKTTSLKLFEQKQQVTNHIQKAYTQRNDIQKVDPSSQNFQYLNQSKNTIRKEKSFQEIMNDARKFLALKKKMEDEEKKREIPKKERKSIKRARKLEKQVKTQTGGKKKSEKEKQAEQEIILSELEIQKFSTESQSIRKILDKIEWLQGLSQKCNIISPLLFRIERKQKGEQTQTDQIKQKQFVYGNKEFLLQLQKFQLELQLMKNNLSQNIEKKDILSPFEIKQLAKWEMQSRAGHERTSSDSHSLIQKYIDRKNQHIYAEWLQNELELMEQNEFQNNYNDSDQQK